MSKGKRTLPRGAAAARRSLTAARAGLKKCRAAATRHQARELTAPDRQAWLREGIELEGLRRDHQLAMDDARAVLALAKRPDLERLYRSYVQKRDVHARVIVDLLVAQLAVRDAVLAMQREQAGGEGTPSRRQGLRAFDAAERRAVSLLSRVDRTEQAMASALSALCSPAGG